MTFRATLNTAITADGWARAASSHQQRLSSRVDVHIVFIVPTTCVDIASLSFKSTIPVFWSITTPSARSILLILLH